MIKLNPNEATDEIIKRLIDAYLLRHTIQFFHKKETGLKPFGSGVFVLIHEVHFILTASHVADHMEENDLYIRVDKKGYINVLGEIKYTEIDKSKGVDLAYIKIDPQMLPHLNRAYKPVTIDKISKHNQRLDGMNYCVLGFPAKNVKNVEGRMETGASFYLTSAINEKPYKHYGFDERDFFLLTMRGKGTDMNSGEKRNIDDRFHGISGCGLWYLILNHDPESNVYSIDYRLIGIMTEFKKGRYFFLVANRIHLLIDAFKIMEGFKFVEKMAEYSFIQL